MPTIPPWTQPPNFIQAAQVGGQLGNEIATLAQRADEFGATSDLERQKLQQDNEQFYSSMGLKRDELDLSNQHFYDQLWADQKAKEMALDEANTRSRDEMARHFDTMAMDKARLGQAAAVHQDEFGLDKQKQAMAEKFGDEKIGLTTQAMQNKYDLADIANTRADKKLSIDQQRADAETQRASRPEKVDRFPEQENIRTIKSELSAAVKDKDEEGIVKANQKLMRALYAYNQPPAAAIKYPSVDAVVSDFKNGKIDRATAKGILKSQFNIE